MNLKTKLAVGMGTVAFMVALAAPAAFAADVTISSNGKDSTNKVKVTTTKKTMLSQKNVAAVSNSVGITQNTGNNKANNNTGGDVVITTGNAKATVTNTTTTGGNVAVLNDCGCVPVDQSLTIKDNGKDSTNTITVSSCDSTMVSQMNMAWVVNQVGVTQNTGMNNANGNTVKDGGDPSITTGNTHATVTNTTTTGDNVYGPATEGTL
jgi:hypothetical protein